MTSAPADRTQHEATALLEQVGIRVMPESALRVSGEDARAWLNGQVTNDVGRAAPGETVYALVLTLKGKVMSDVRVLVRGDEDFLLLLPRERRDAVAEHFDNYIIMEDVDLESDDDVTVITVQGPAADDVVQKVDAARAAAWPADRLGVGGRDVVVSSADHEQVLAALHEAAPPGSADVSEAGWELARLRVGRGRMGTDFGDWTLPQEAGLRHAIAFGKGCYQGQEAVVMLEHRGKPPKRLVRLDVEGAPPPRQTPMHDEQGTRLGQITSAMADPSQPEHGWALGYVKRGHACEGTRLTAADAHVVVREILGG